MFSIPILHDFGHELDLPDTAIQRLSSLRRLPEAPDPRLPTDVEARTMLDEFGVDVEDRVDILAARPDPAAHPALWAILTSVYHDVLAHMGVPVSIDGFPGYPALPASTGAVGRHLPVWTFLTLARAIRHYHAGRDIPKSISTRSLGEALAVALRAHRSVMGLSGLGLWGFGWTLPLRFRGVDYQLGRLGFHLGEMSLSDGACGYVLGVHILGNGRLDPNACHESMAQARAFFAEHFPDRPISLMSCESWLMDPQLADYLSPTSNIVRFQRLFHILPLPPDRDVATRCDEEMLGYVFNVSSNIPLNDLPQDTSLQRAFLAHIREGKHWHARVGWRPVNEPNALLQGS